MGGLTDEPLSIDSTVAEALVTVPHAARLFERHGVDPRKACGMLTRFVTLGEAELRCRLSDVDGLIDELNAARKPPPPRP